MGFISAGQTCTAHELPPSPPVLMAQCHPRQEVVYMVLEMFFFMKGIALNLGDNFSFFLYCIVCGGAVPSPNFPLAGLQTSPHRPLFLLHKT